MKEKNSISALDRAEIHDLIALYSFTWDSADANAFADLFTDDAQCFFYLNGATEATSILQGKQEMKKAALDRAGFFKKIGLVTKHLMPNTVITVLDSDNVNTLTQALITWQMLSKDSVPHAVQAGYYESIVSRTPDGWKYRRRDVRLNGVFSVKQVFGT